MLIKKIKDESLEIWNEAFEKYAPYEFGNVEESDYKIDKV